MKGLMKVFSDGSAIWRERRIDRIDKRVHIGECAGRQRKRWIDTMKYCLKRSGCQAIKENNA